VSVAENRNLGYCSFAHLEIEPPGSFYRENGIETLNRDHLGKYGTAMTCAGAPYYFNIWHPKVLEWTQNNLRVSASDLKDDPNCITIEIWNEPSLQGSNLALKREGYVGFSSVAKKAFSEFLKQRYGTIEKLNHI
jgi:hypothetical protein